MNRNIITQADVDELERTALLDGMRALQRQCFDTSAQHGFHDIDAQNLDGNVYNDDDPTRDDVLVPRAYLEMLQDTRRLMLIVSEASEALEHQRDSSPHVFYVCPKCGAKAPQDIGEHLAAPEFALRCSHLGPMKPDGLGAELADVVIRALDQAERAEIDLPKIIMEKMEFNKGRPHRHGRAW